MRKLGRFQLADTRALSLSLSGRIKLVQQSRELVLIPVSSDGSSRYLARRQQEACWLDGARFGWIAKRLREPLLWLSLCRPIRTKPNQTKLNQTR